MAEPSRRHKNCYNVSKIIGAVLAGWAPAEARGFGEHTRPRVWCSASRRTGFPEGRRKLRVRSSTDYVPRGRRWHPPLSKSRSDVGNAKFFWHQKAQIGCSPWCISANGDASLAAWGNAPGILTASERALKARLKQGRCFNPTHSVRHTRRRVRAGTHGILPGRCGCDDVAPGSPRIRGGRRAGSGSPKKAP